MTLLAYLSTHSSGFIPCRVVARIKDSIDPRIMRDRVRIVLTAARPGYRKGEFLNVTRTALSGRPLRRSGYKLRGFYLLPHDLAGLPVLESDPLPPYRPD